MIWDIIIKYVIISYPLFVLITASSSYSEQKNLVKKSFIYYLISIFREFVIGKSWWLFMLSPIMIPVIIIGEIKYKK